MSVNTTPAMSLPNPVPTVEPGPTYASDIETCLNTIDAHGHTGAPNDGYKIVSSAININGDLTFNVAYNLTSVRSVRLVNNTNTLSGAGDINSIYFHSGNFYINNGTGNPVQITAGSSVVGGSGTSANTYQYVAVNGNFAISSSDGYCFLDVDTTSARTITLPAASSVTAGRFYIIKDKTGSSVTNNITINRAGSDTIDGATSAVVNTNYGVITLVSNGSNGWRVVLPIKQIQTRSVTTYTVDSTGPDDILLVDSSATRTITLPSPTAGRILTIKDSKGLANTNNITVARAGSEKIDGIAASYIYKTNWGALRLTSNGTDWFII